MTTECEELNSTKGIKVIYLNARSLLGHFDEIRFSLLRHNFDVIIFGESWLHENVPDSLIHCAGYKTVRYDRQVIGKSGKRKAGGGICMYIRQDITVKELSGSNESNGDIELVNVGIQIRESRRFTLSAVYRPPAGNVDKFLEMLSASVCSAKAEFGGDCVVIGDMNIDYGKTGVSQFRKLKKVADKLNLGQIIKSDTRVTNKSHSMIDLIFTNMNHISKAGTLNVNISDHYPIYMVKKKTRNEIHRKVFVGRNYRGLDETAFQADIDSIDRNYLFEDPDPNVIWSKLLSHIRAIADRHCPKTEMRITVDKPGFLEG